MISNDTTGKFLIIGAGGGIGRALTGILTDAGHQVLACGRSQEKLDALAKDYSVETTVLDARDFDAVEKAFRGAGDLLGAVNLAGTILLKPAHSTSYDEYLEQIHENLTTAFALVRAAGRNMRSGGSVVLMSSSAATVGLTSHEAIAAAKGGVVGLTQAAAASYVGQKLRVNCLAPGLTQTPLAEPITSRERARKASESMHPLGRLGEADEVARLIAFLLDPKNDWITGQRIGIDGGLSGLRA